MPPAIPKAVFGKDGLVEELKKAPSERIPNTEIDAHLETEKAEGKANHRNGYSRKSVLTATSMVKAWAQIDAFNGSIVPQLGGSSQRTNRLAE